MQRTFIKTTSLSVNGYLSNQTNSHRTIENEEKREKLLLPNYHQQENIRGGEFVFIQSITFSMKLKISYVIKHSLLNTSVYWVCRFDSLCYSKNDLMFLLSNFAIDRLCNMGTKFEEKLMTEQRKWGNCIRFHYQNWMITIYFGQYFLLKS